jgi:flagellar basal-body rod modification protein FlgD
MASGVGATTSTGSSTASTKSSSGTIANNFNQFLLLLTTQLKNQNPLDPLDTNQFTQQLVQFSSVEQQLRTNDTLASLLTATKSSSASSVAGFIGLNVTADGTTTNLSGGSATWNLNATRAARAASITISDKDGNVVATRTQALNSGSQSFTWDGKTSTGLAAPDGDYTIKVTALDATGQSVSVKTEVSGKVDGVDMSGDTPILLIGATRVPVTSVKSLGS